MAINRKVKYFRNLTPNPIRVLDVNFGPRGARDVAEVPVDKTTDPKFAPSVGLLIEELTPAAYNERIAAAYQETSVARPGYKAPQVYTVVQKPGGESAEIKQDVEIEGHQPMGLRREIDNSQFVGSDFATGSRPDPAAGKTLTEVRLGQ